MALKSTIFKSELSIADMDRHYYADHSLTLARHPSETDERMMVRVLAFAAQAGERLEFCKGLSDADEPALWEKDLTGAIECWVEVGLPDERRLAKACGRSARVVVYAYGGSAVQVWWKAIAGKLGRLGNLAVFCLPTAGTRALAELVERSMRLSVSIQDGEMLLTSLAGVVDLRPEVLKAADA
jgi:uncharacterized protein YaeQ